MRRWPFRKVLALVVAANVLLGGVLFVLRPPQDAAETAGPPPELPASVQDLQAKRGHGERYTLDLSDEELTAVAGYFVAAAPDVPFAGVKVGVTGEKVVVDGVTKGLAVAVPVRVTGAVAARDGGPAVRVEDVSLGATALPSFAREQVLHEANRSLDFSRYPMPLTVDAVELRPGGMTVHGTVK